MKTISISYKKAPLEIRNIFAFSYEEQIEFIKRAVENENIRGCIILCTCNRMEVYFEGNHSSPEIMQRLLCDARKVSVESVIKYFNIYIDEKAIKHLFKVTGGIDSMVLGEDEILGQVKDAYELALKCGTTSFVLNTVFKQAITAAKRAKTLTMISKTPVSIGTLAANIVFNLDKEQKKVLIIGASGKMGRLVAKNLLSKPNIKVFGTLRAHKAEDYLEVKYDNLSYVSYQDRYKYINESDVIISVTSSPHYTVTLEDFILTSDTTKKRLFIDLAVPNDIEKKIGQISNAELFDIDYFETLSKENNLLKKQEAENAKDVLEEGYNETLKELAFHEFVPKIPMIKEYFEENGIEKAIYSIRKYSDKDTLISVLKALEMIAGV